MMETLDYLVLLGYFVLMAGIGLTMMRRIKVQEDYFMGGRGFGKLLQTFAAFGAGTGSSDPVTTGRTTFTSGMSGMWSTMSWLFVTPFYWITGVWYRRMRHTTLGDWFVERYESRALGAAYTLFGLFFYFVYGSMFFAAIGKVAVPMVGANTVTILGTTMGLEYALVPAVGVVVLLYGIAGGLGAAYWTDLVQGLCIILLSVMLIPFGLNALVEKFGDPATDGPVAGFRIIHEQLPAAYFTATGNEFPLLRTTFIVLILLLGVVVQPHFIATGGGTAKTESTARIGLVTGNFLKRFCTVGWVLTGLIAAALYSDRPELVTDPDHVWGLASRDLLAPGLTGLMLACLLAALMSSVDAYMIVSSALVVRNIYIPFINPNASEAHCVRVARYTGAIVVGGSVVVALLMNNVLEQLMVTWYLPMIFASPFWIGMFWRRATSAAAWTTILASALLLFVLPPLLPVVCADLRESERYSVVTEIIETTTTRQAAPSDVARRAARREWWHGQRSAAVAIDNPKDRERQLAIVGTEPDPLRLGDSLTDVQTQGGVAAYWTEGVQAVDADSKPLEGIRPQQVGPIVRLDGQTTQRTLQYEPGVRLRGQGNFRVDFLFYDLLGFDLAAMDQGTLQSLDLPMKMIVPFVLMIVVSLLTPRNTRYSLDRFYVKMKTPVAGSPEEDAAEMAESYRNPHRFDRKRLLNFCELEFQRPTLLDLAGFVACFAICFAIIGLAVWISGIGG